MIEFVAEGVAMPSLSEAETIDWLERVIDAEGGHLSALTYIFCNDDYLHQLNVEYLEHDTLTDVITFWYAEAPEVNGDIYISLDRVADNAVDLGHSFEAELNRVIVHGLLHLLGYRDESDAEEAAMRAREDHYLHGRISAQP